MEKDRESGTPNLPAYDPPQVEEVLSAEDLAREVNYAGTPVSGGGGGGG